MTHKLVHYLMAVEEHARFECGHCGATAQSTEVSYTLLGFPICPECETQTGYETIVQADRESGFEFTS